jgi:tetratricopeptide (TPR) repeat protein
LDIAASLGSMLTTARRESEARGILSRFLPMARKIGTPEQVGWLVLYLATANQHLGHRDEASAQFREAHASSESSGAMRLQHFTLHHWGRFLAEERELDRARECFERALALRVESNDPRQDSSRKALEALRLLENGAAPDAASTRVGPSRADT